MNLNDIPAMNSHLIEPDKVVQDLGGDKETYIEVAEFFLQDVENTLAALDAASASDGPERLISVLHELANSLGVIGGTRGEGVVRRAEESLHQGAPTEFKQHAASVAKALLMQTATALRDWIDGSADRPIP